APVLARRPAACPSHRDGLPNLALRRGRGVAAANLQRFSRGVLAAAGRAGREARASRAQPGHRAAFLGDGTFRSISDATAPGLGASVNASMPIAILKDRLWFPNPRGANADGLVAVGGDLSADRLLLAYRSGIFPWTARPVTWWSPDPRAVLELNALH